MNDRFIALHMMYDRIAPEEPTSAPVMISRLLLNMNPAAAAAHPEYEFSIDTTTGMSPPPIAATRCRPRTRAITVMISNGQILGAARYQASRAALTISAPRFNQFRQGRVNGEDFIFADSFRYAMIEPVKVTAPMKTPRNTSTRWMLSADSSVRYDLNPTSTAARPTKLCRIAISSGMWVISTLRATRRPITAPISSAAAIRPAVTPAF